VSGLLMPAADEEQVITTHLVGREVDEAAGQGTNVHDDSL